MIPPITDFHYRSDDGLRLHTRIYGDDIAGRRPVVCLPGLTRNVRDSHGLAVFLSAGHEPRRQVVAFDYRGRGGSQYDADWKNYNVGVEARDVISGLAALAIEKADFIGTSRGGLIIHRLADIRPDLVGNVVLNDIGPAIESVGLSDIRTYLQRRPELRSLDDAVAHLRKVHGESFLALNSGDWARMADAVYRLDGDTPVADFDPALIDTLAGLDLDAELPTLWPQFDRLACKPLLLIRGANSRLLAPNTVAEMQMRHPAMELVTVDGQGHPPMLETGNLPDIIASFLDRHAS